MHGHLNVKLTRSVREFGAEENIWAEEKYVNNYEYTTTMRNLQTITDKFNVCLHTTSRKA